MLKRVLLFTFLTEGIGALILFSRLSQILQPGQALWQSVFHAVSAFCNAGFSLFSDSLMHFTGDPVVNLTVMALIFLGGIGFVVFSEIFDFSWRKIAKKKRKSLSLHSRIVLLASLTLIVTGAILFFILEFQTNDSTGKLHEKILSSFFLSVTARTAGFNTVATGQLTNATLLIVIILMVVGASPGSTGGGIKTSTFAIILATLWSKIRNRPQVEVHNRRIPDSIVSKAFATLIAYIFVVLTALIFIELIEAGFAAHQTGHSFFLDYIFEVVSALSTVGLSTGITAKLMPASQTVLIFCMFFGRIGPLFVATSIIGARKSLNYTLPEEEIMVG